MRSIGAEDPTAVAFIVVHLLRLGDKWIKLIGVIVGTQLKIWHVYPHAIGAPQATFDLPQGSKPRRTLGARQD
jgi:hypothetical protein